MKQMRIFRLGLIAFTASAIGLFSCKKDAASSTSEASGSAIDAAVQSTGAIAVGTSGAKVTSPGDSIYVINACARGDRKDSIAFSSLPTSIGTYLSTNYSGYTFQKAYSIKDSSGTLQGYVVIIQYNGNPVGLKFDASGNFVKVLEQREGRDLLNDGWHSGGHFEHRGDVRKDTVALTALPSGILTYMSTSYPSDTVLAASRTNSGSYVVLSKNNGLFATVFDSYGNYVNRVSLPVPVPKAAIKAITQMALLSSISNYLTTTYPGYVFEKAFSVSLNNAIQGYVVIIEANSTKYAVEFDASGSYVKVKAIR